MIIIFLINAMCSPGWRTDGSVLIGAALKGRNNIFRISLMNMVPMDGISSF